MLSNHPPAVVVRMSQCVVQVGNDKTLYCMYYDCTLLQVYDGTIGTE